MTVLGDVAGAATPCGASRSIEVSLRRARPSPAVLFVGVGLGVGAPGLDLKPTVDGPASASRAIVSRSGIRLFPPTRWRMGRKSGVPMSQCPAPILKGDRVPFGVAVMPNVIRSPLGAAIGVVLGGGRSRMLPHLMNGSSPVKRDLPVTLGCQTLYGSTRMSKSHCTQPLGPAARSAAR